ncbi:MAG: hypothetical protein AB7F43_02785 [Bacteriovoracia bacterium]
MRPSRKKNSKQKVLKKKTKLTLAQPDEFFKTEVSRAIESQQVRVEPSTKSYLVDLLLRFMFTENLFRSDENSGTKHEEVLALLLAESVSTEDTGKKIYGLQRLGDISLYTAGFFGESLSRKVVDIDYYIGMGKNAYGNLAQLHVEKTFQKVFTDLSERFHKFVDVLGEISQAANLNDAKDILRLYEVWLKTRSERAEKSLKEIGIIPNTTLKKTAQ